MFHSVEMADDDINVVQFVVLDKNLDRFQRDSIHRQIYLDYFELNTHKHIN